MTARKVEGRHQAVAVHDGAGSEGTVPDISVVVPVYNGLPHLVSSLDSIVDAGRIHGAVEIIVVDNGSTDGSYELVRERYGDVARLRRLADGNVGAVRNVGAEAARGRYLSFVDSDCTIAPDYFARAERVMAEEGADATGSAYRLPEAPHWVEATWAGLHQAPEDGRATYLPAGNFFCKRAVFEAVGGFDESLESGEDAELCSRLRREGYRIYRAREVAAVHLGNPKSVPDFFRKQLWHADGMMGTFRHEWKDLPVLATVAHLTLTTLGLAAFFLGGPSVSTFSMYVLPAVLMVPILSVVYRYATTGGDEKHPLRGVFLYSLYFAARGLALARLPFKG